MANNSKSEMRADLISKFFEAVQRCIQDDDLDVLQFWIKNESALRDALREKIFPNGWRPRHDSGITYDGFGD